MQCWKFWCVGSMMKNCHIVSHLTCHLCRNNLMVAYFLFLELLYEHSNECFSVKQTVKLWLDCIFIEPSWYRWRHDAKSKHSQIQAEMLLWCGNSDRITTNVPKVLPAKAVENKVDAKICDEKKPRNCLNYDCGVGGHKIPLIGLSKKK